MNRQVIKALALTVFAWLGFSASPTMARSQYSASLSIVCADENGARLSIEDSSSHSSLSGVFFSADGRQHVVQAQGHFSGEYGYLGKIVNMIKVSLKGNQIFIYNGNIHMNGENADYLFGAVSLRARDGAVYDSKRVDCSVQYH